MRAAAEIETLLPELRAYALSLSGDGEAAADLVQDAVERTLRAQNRPQAISDLRPWMFRVIRNLHFDELRKWRRRREYLAAEKRLSDGASRTADHARDVLIRMAYERLPAEKREILFLVDIIGLKYDEASEVIGIARGTVMSRLSRARQALREAIGTDQAERAGPGRRTGVT